STIMIFKIAFQIQLKNIIFQQSQEKLTPFLWTKPQNTCMEAEAGSRSCFKENLMSASASAFMSTSTSTSILSDKFNKIINEEKNNELIFLDWI
ncbi:MAG: hypothetical protein QF457_12655, partial [SAR324 cluster bacterium]|nr:hypothetical protein [SAR324 cluster bacterium]